MDRLKAKQLLPILMTFAEGKTIEVNEQYGCEPHWEPLSNDPIWCKDACHYRIKPEPKYIPYTHAEAIENLKGRWVIRKSSGSLCVIAGICRKSKRYAIIRKSIR